ncbi:MAG: hypothetical protein RLY86_2330 [Pseudomonadota bacterium]|jgi:hypothetical protein
MTGGWILAILVGIASFAWSLDRSLNKVRGAKARYKAIMAKRQAQVDRLKKAALQTLYLKRERSQLRQSRDELREDCDRLEAERRHVARPENRIFVLDERRMPVDQGWIILLEAPTGDYARHVPWTGARRFMVWSPDEEGARIKIHRRYQETHGFRITGMSVRKPAAVPPPELKRANNG